MGKETKETKNDSKFSEIGDDTKKFFNDLMKSMNTSYSLKYVLLNNSKLKNAVKVMKVSEIYQHISNAEIIVLFNENIFDVLDDTAKSILLKQEIDRIHVDLDSGKIKLIKPDVITFSGIIKKYGLDKVARANQLNELVKEGEDLNAKAETFLQN
jgi:hypothetical protein